MGYHMLRPSGVRMRIDECVRGVEWKEHTYGVYVVVPYPADARLLLVDRKIGVWYLCGDPSGCSITA